MYNGQISCQSSSPYTDRNSICFKTDKKKNTQSCNKKEKNKQKKKTKQNPLTQCTYGTAKNKGRQLWNNHLVAPHMEKHGSPKAELWLFLFNSHQFIASTLWKRQPQSYKYNTYNFELCLHELKSGPECECNSKLGKFLFVQICMLYLTNRRCQYIVFDFIFLF